MRLTSVSSAGRYTAGDALKHPWITRKLHNSIPMNQADEMLNLEYEQRLRQKMRAIQFLSIMKFKSHKSPSFDTKSF
jgi:calcium/calmodulin-dependent protein kinase I